MDHKAEVIASCWLAVGIISSVYMLEFANKLGDLVFGLFVPVGALVFVALMVTFTVAYSSAQDKPGHAESQSNFQGVKLKLDEITREIEQVQRQLKY